MSRKSEGRSVLTICEEKFLKFVRRMNPYFELIAASVPRRSEWCQKFWGLVFLVFKVLLL